MLVVLYFLEENMLDLRVLYQKTLTFPIGSAAD